MQQFWLGLIVGVSGFYLITSWLAFEAMYAGVKNRPHWLWGVVSGLYVLLVDMYELRKETRELKGGQR